MKKLRNLGLAFAMVATLALNFGVMGATVQVAESNTPCTDRYDDYFEEDGQWCACMWGRYGYEC
ncbi:MAG: hypothetical protein AAF604_07585 [Acidobacteriota bacterium]